MMEFKSTLDFFEGSIFSEEFIGDFTKIRERLQELRAEGPSDPEQKAWVKFLESIFSMLTGNLTRAFESLREISLIEYLPPKWLLRTTAYDAFYNSLRLYPSIIRFRPNFGGPTAAFRILELGFSEKNNEFIKTMNAYLDTDLPLFRFEARVLLFMLWASLPLWNNAFINHPSYPRGPWETLKAKSQQEMTQRAKLFKANRDQAINLNIYQLDKYMSRLEVELEYGKSPERSQMVESIKNRYRTFVDKHNLAIIKMIEADHVLSPPFSNPVALNLILTEDLGPGKSVTPWNSVEDKLEVGDTALASQLYEQAFHLFTDSASRRGCAAVLLRQGCIEHMLALPHDILPGEKVRRCETARQKFAESLRLFELDEAHSQIVRGHQILLRITSGNDSNIIQEATAIGSWGKVSSNEMISQFVGILMQRFGRRQMLKYARNDVALKCYKCAQACFTSLGDRFGLFRSLNSELYLLSSMNDHLATRGMIEKPKEVFRELLVYLRKMEDKHPSSKSECDTVRQDIILVFGNLISSVHHKVGDFGALEQWKEELRVNQGGQENVKGVIDRSVKTVFNKYVFKGRVSGDVPPSLLRRRDFSAREESLLLSDKDPSAPQQSFSDYIKEGLEWYERYMEASSRWRDALWQFDIDNAYCYLRKYVKQAAPENISSHPENLWPIFAAAELGELGTSRKILRNMLNPKFLDSHVNHKTRAEENPLQTIEDTLQESLEIDNVLAACAVSQDWDLAYQLLGRIRKLFPKYVNSNLESTPTTHWSRLAWVGAIYEHNNVPLEAFPILLKASQLVEQDRSSTSSPNSRRGIFSSDPFGEIFHGLARLCLRAGELGLPLAILDAHSHNHRHVKTWQEHALLFLEQSKARNLLDSLTANQPDSINPLGSIFYEINSAANVENLYSAIGQDEIVIEADFSGNGFTIFGITSTGIEFAQHRLKNWYEIRNLVARIMKHLIDYPKDKESHSRAVLEVLLKEISDDLILPLKGLIQTRKHVIFVASQPLAAFPFSTLLLDDEPLFLRLAVSQAPSLGTLLHLWKSNQTSDNSPDTFDSPVSVSTIVKAARLVKSESKKRQEPVLFLAAIETMIIARTFNSWPLDCSHISRKDFQSLIETGNLGRTDNHGAPFRILHIGTHGTYDPHNPWVSSISLKEKFTVLDVGRARPRGHRRMALIVFAACLSGMGQGTLGNDVLGFAQAMLERDCNAYLGALWNVADKASMLLMVLFYQHLSKSVAERSTSSAQIAKLWQEAQKSLYHLTIESARELIADLVNVLESAERDGHDPKEFVKSWRSKLESVVENMEDGKLDLKHPFYWGAFVVVGCGGMALVSS